MTCDNKMIVSVAGFEMIDECRLQSLRFSLIIVVGKYRVISFYLSFFRHFLYILKVKIYEHNYRATFYYQTKKREQK